MKIARIPSILVIAALIGFGTGCERADMTAPEDLAPQFNSTTGVTSGPGAVQTPVRNWRVVAAAESDQTGGWLSASGGHLFLSGDRATSSLTVPRQAVMGQVYFSMSFLDGELGVELRATSMFAAEGANDVGAAGFKRPVQLCFSYSLEDVEGAVRVGIARKNGGSLSLMAGSETTALNGQVCALLGSFSQYVMVAD
jgi:hypothetical protein